VLDHLEDRADHELGGLVLTGSVQLLDRGGCARLVELAATRLTPGAVFALASVTPGAWAAADPVLLDLATGRPLHAATWAHLLGTAGFEDVEVHAHAGWGGSGPTAAGADPYESYLVVARRPVAPRGPR
jgi:hypothetical protein